MHRVRQRLAAPTGDGRVEGRQAVLDRARQQGVGIDRRLAALVLQEDEQRKREERPYNQRTISFHPPEPSASRARTRMP